MRLLPMARLPLRVPSTPLRCNVRHVRAYAEGGPLRVRWTRKSSVRPLPRKGSPEGPLLSVKEGVLTARANGEPYPVPGRWLRDNCSCAECRNADTAQRKINVFQNPEAGKVVNVVEKQEGESRIDYEVEFADGHKSTIPQRLISHRKDWHSYKSRYGLVEQELWNADISSNPPVVEHADAVQEGEGMADLLAKIRKRGFCFVDNMPATPEASQAFLEQIGPIRNTHYGGFYDFTSDLSSKDTAYTSESLEPHTDTTYFTEPIGLQALHLLSHTHGSGGLSSLTDGLSCAASLFQTDSSAYGTLSRTGVFAHASGNEGVSIQPSKGFPVLNHIGDVGHLHQVRWNTADRAGVNAGLGPKMDAWYDAAGKFDALVNDPKNQYWFQLKPGRMLIFDNWRVLHGRSSFTGKRRMCGGYINRDDFISKYRMTNLSKEELAASTVTG